MSDASSAAELARKLLTLKPPADVVLPRPRRMSFACSVLPLQVMSKARIAKERNYVFATYY